MIYHLKIVDINREHFELLACRDKDEPFIKIVSDGSFKVIRGYIFLNNAFQHAYGESVAGVRLGRNYEPLAIQDVKTSKENRLK